MIVKQEDIRHPWIWRKLVSPLVRSLRHGTSPQRIAWSVAAGVVIGLNPLVGSSTVLTIAVTHVLGLKHAASQVGVHTAYPLQLLLFLPFIHVGSVLFKTDPLPLEKAEILRLMHEHPLQLLRSVWMWEWHALVVWLGVAALLTPAIALLLKHMLERAMRHPRATREEVTQFS